MLDKSYKCLAYGSFERATKGTYTFRLIIKILLGAGLGRGNGTHSQAPQGLGGLLSQGVEPGWYNFSLGGVFPRPQTLSEYKGYYI